MLKNKYRRLLTTLKASGCIIFFAILTNAWSMPRDVRMQTLLSVYYEALHHDPLLQQAKANQWAQQEKVPQARSVLLPSLTGSVTMNATRNSLSNTDHSVNQHDYGVSLTQPVFHVSGWMQLEAAQALSLQADAAYRSALESLITRVSQAYFNALLAKDVLHFTQAQLMSVATQLKQVRVRYQVGVATMTDVYQVMAAHAALKAQVISAQNNLLNALQSLTVSTGKDYDARFLAGFQKNIQWRTPLPDKVQAWVAAAQKNNQDFLAACYAEQAAKKNIRVYQTAHLPSVNAVGSYQAGNNLSSSQGNAPLNTHQWQSSVGLQVSVPLYQGGYTLSKTREAQDQYLSASAQTESMRRQAAFLAQQSFNNVESSLLKIKADQLSVLSAQSAQKSAVLAYQAGTKTILDVLNAEQAVYSAKTQEASDQYNYLLNTLLLKQAAGCLTTQDIIALSRWLAL